MKIGEKGWGPTQLRGEVVTYEGGGFLRKALLNYIASECGGGKGGEKRRGGRSTSKIG